MPHVPRSPVRPFPRLAASLLLALALSAGACGSDDDPLGPADLTGAWSGSTSQNRVIEFDISAQGFVRGSFTFVLNGARCSVPRTIEIVGGTAVPIQNGEFTVPPTQIGPNAFLSAEGHFTSSTAANGTLTIEDGDCPSNITSTWTATKQ